MRRSAIREETGLAMLKKRFWCALALLFCLALACAIQARTRLGLERTRAELLKAGTGLTRVRQAGAARREALASFRPPPEAAQAHASVEKLLYGGVDRLQARFRPDDLTVSSIERKGDRVSLQYSFTFLNPSFDDFLNAVSSLEGTGFPLTLVDSVSIARAEGGKGALNCTVNGTVLAFAGDRP